MKVKTGNNVTKSEAELVKHFVNLCLKEISKAEHEIMLGSKRATLTALRNFNIDIKAKSQRSYGGAARISIDVMNLRKGKTFLHEYKAYADDPVIGAVETFDPELVLLGVVAHEIAHYIQHRTGVYTSWLKRTYKKPHGEGFQAIYRILRSRVVNPLIEARAKAA